MKIGYFIDVFLGADIQIPITHREEKVIIKEVRCASRRVSAVLSVTENTVVKDAFFFLDYWQSAKVSKCPLSVGISIKSA